VLLEPIEPQFQTTNCNDVHLSQYFGHRLMGPRLIESAAFCYQIWLAKLFINSAQNTSVN
jgi:hypothetical protein